MMPIDDLDELVRRCNEAQAAVKAHEATPGVDETPETWEAELGRLSASRNRLCADAERETSERQRQQSVNR